MSNVICLDSDVHISLFTTVHSALRPQGQNAHASIVRIICAEDEKKGIDFPTKVSLC